MGEGRLQRDDLPSPLSPLPSSSPLDIHAWALYDWACSAQSTLVITFAMSYLTTVVLPGKAGEAAYTFGFGLAMLAAALLSPIVGAMADANRSKRRWLAVTALAGASAALVMAALPVEWPWAIVAAFVLMNLCCDLSMVPYNGFLAEIADEHSINRVSGYGFALGYLGGSLPLLAAVGIVWWGQQNGTLDTVAQHKAGLLLIGLWWGLFSLPVIYILRDRGGPPAVRRPPVAAARAAFGEVGRSLRNVRRYRILALFLLAFMLYNDGIATIFSQATIVTKEVEFSLVQNSWFILVIQWVALPSALAVGWLADRVGQKAVILGCLAVWIGVAISAVLVQTQAQFWLLGIAVALVLGGTQSVSRAAMGMMTPRSRAAEFMGFFNVSSKAASCLGPILFGTVNAMTGDARSAAAALAVFFIFGGAIVARLNFAAGRAAALREE